MTDYASNYVVIVTAISHCASLWPLPTDPHSDQLHTLLASHCMMLSFARHIIPSHGFSDDAWLLSACCVSHANPTLTASVFACVYMCHVDMSQCLHACFFWKCQFFKTEQSEGKTHTWCRHLKYVCLMRNRLWTALSQQTAGFVSGSWTHPLPHRASSSD